jgi:YidC/Oxa1 family membrane protein insertase
MNFFINLYNTVLYRPLFNALIIFYQLIPGHDFGVAVILLTILTRLIIYPLMTQSLKSQKTLAGLQPKIQEIQDKYKDDKERQGKELISLYQREKINPFGGLLPLLIQLPILIALYQVFWKGLRPEEITNLYSFVSQPGVINPSFLGLINLGQASLTLAILAGICQFFQSKEIISQSPQQSKKTDQMSQFSNMLQKEMLYFFPIFTVLILWKLPAAIALYWITTSLFSLVQQYTFFKPRSEKI